jgi:deoxyhypusine synthase
MIVRELFAKLGIEVDEAAFHAADAAIAGVKGGLIAIGAAVSAARLALAAMVKSTADYATEVHNLAQTTGVTTENLQVLGYAGKLAGVGMEEVASGLTHLSKSAFEASTSGGAAGEAFYRLGIDAYDASGKVKDINQLLPEVAVALGKVTNPTERTALAMQLLGRGGARLTQTFAKFGGDLEAVKKEAVALGIVLDEKTIAQGEALVARSTG